MQIHKSLMLTCYTFNLPMQELLFIINLKVSYVDLTDCRMSGLAGEYYIGGRGDVSVDFISAVETCC